MSVFELKSLQVLSTSQRFSPVSSSSSHPKEVSYELPLPYPLLFSWSLISSSCYTYRTFPRTTVLSYQSNLCQTLLSSPKRVSTFDFSVFFLFLEVDFDFVFFGFLNSIVPQRLLQPHMFISSPPPPTITTSSTTITAYRRRPPHYHCMLLGRFFFNLWYALHHYQTQFFCKWVRC